MDSRKKEEKTCFTHLKKTFSGAAVGASITTTVSLAGYALFCRLLLPFVVKTDNIDNGAWLQWLLFTVPKSAVEQNIPQIAAAAGGASGAIISCLKSLSFFEPAPEDKDSQIEKRNNTTPNSSLSKKTANL